MNLNIEVAESYQSIRRGREVLELVELPMSLGRNAESSEHFKAQDFELKFREELESWEVEVTDRGCNVKAMAV